MGIFQKKSDFDIHCSDRKLKDLIDECYHEKPDWDGYYESRAIFCVEDGIKYRKLLKMLLEDGYAKHQHDPTCDIPDYRTFISLEPIMLNNPPEYHNKSVCVEGYIAWYLWDYSEWNRDNAGVGIYPLPCQTNAEKKINYALMDDLNITNDITLVSDQPLPLSIGLHIRVHGVPYFYETDDGSRPGRVHILVSEFEIIQ